MPDEKLSVVIGMPEGYWNLFDEETTARLLDPHPNVVVETARDAEQFFEKLPRPTVRWLFGLGFPRKCCTKVPDPAGYTLSLREPMTC